MMPKLAGCETGVLRVGETGPLLMLSHCSLAHSGAWKPLLGALPPVRAIAPDLPGHGRTVRDPAQVADAQATAAVLELLDAEDGPVHLVGHSYGGRVVTRVALARPDRIASLTLIEPMMMHLLDDVGDPLYAEELAHGRAYMEGTDPDVAGAGFTAAWGDGTPWDKLPERQRAYTRSLMGFVTASTPEVMMHPPGQITLDQIAGITCPIALIAGARTRPAALAICGHIQAATGAALHVVPNAGHMVAISHPDDVARILSGTLA